MSDVSPFSLFDQSGKSKKNSPFKKEDSLPKSEGSPISDKEAIEMIQKMKKTHEEFSAKIDNAFTLLGKSREEIATLCEKPENFDQQDYEEYIQRKEEMEAKILGISKDLLKKEKRKKADKLASKDRRGKMLGGRKRWLDMH